MGKSIYSKANPGVYHYFDVVIRCALYILVCHCIFNGKWGLYHPWKFIAPICLREIWIGLWIWCYISIVLICICSHRRIGDLYFFVSLVHFLTQLTIMIDSGSYGWISKFLHFLSECICGFVPYNIWESNILCTPFFNVKHS